MRIRTLYIREGVSIHAPTRGATHLPPCKVAKYVSFNPRTHEGCDKEFMPSDKRTKSFQSTHPRGVRLCLHLYSKVFYFGFNPRTHEGCDYLLFGV